MREYKFMVENKNVLLTVYSDLLLLHTTIIIIITIMYTPLNYLWVHTVSRLRFAH